MLAQKTKNDFESIAARFVCDLSASGRLGTQERARTHVRAPGLLRARLEDVEREAHRGPARVELYVVAGAQAHEGGRRPPGLRESARAKNALV